MAEYLLRDRLGPDMEWGIRSAGITAGSGMPASDGAVSALGERGIDLSPHRSRPVTRELVDAASLVVVMTTSHREQIGKLFSDSKEKTFLLKSFVSASGGGDIDDPIGSSADTYRGIRDEIEAALPELISFMKSLV